MTLQKQSKTIIILLVLVVLLTLIPLLMNKDAEYGGADGAAEEAITEINPDYEPWAEPLWEPPSGEIESLLFSVQVAIGALALGYGLGVLKERRRKSADHR